MLPGPIWLLLFEVTLSSKVKSTYVYPNTHDFRDALTRAKNRIRYHQTKYDSGYGDEWKHFIAIIEEFELYTLLELRNTKK